MTYAAVLLIYMLIGVLYIRRVVQTDIDFRVRPPDLDEVIVGVALWPLILSDRGIP